MYKVFFRQVIVDSLLKISGRHFNKIYLFVNVSMVTKPDIAHVIHFRDYKEYHTDTFVKFVVKMTPENMAKSEEAGLHKVFKLQTTITTNSMVWTHLFLAISIKESTCITSSISVTVPQKLLFKLYLFYSVTKCVSNIGLIVMDWMQTFIQIDFINPVQSPYLCLEIKRIHWKKTIWTFYFYTLSNSVHK